MISTASESAPAGIVAAPESGAPAVPTSAPGAMGRAAYSLGYCVSFGIAYPAFLLASFIPVNSAVGRGICDGAQAAGEGHRRFQQRAAAARDRLGDAYTGVAAAVGQRVESIQDSLAERKHRRRIARA